MAPATEPEDALRRVEVLRLGHRPGRDPRLTTHLALTARAFRARAIHLEPPDPDLARRVASATDRFGGAFRVHGVTAWRPFLQKWPGPKLHLTMYGEDLDDVLPRVPSEGPVLVVVGGPKVPREVYELATFNLAVTHQPHSEVAALAITLDRLLGTPKVERREGARLEVRPHPRGKVVVDRRGVPLPDLEEEEEPEERTEALGGGRPPEQEEVEEGGVPSPSAVPPRTRGGGPGG